MGNIIVLNLGSTSYKFKLFTRELDLLASGGVENIGAPESAYRLAAGEARREGVWKCATHEDAFAQCLDALVEMGALSSLGDLDAVGYKAVHGGRISGARLVDEEVLSEMERMCVYAPAHNPIYLRSMRGLRERYPGLAQVASFETTFHQTIPEYRAVYGLPYEWVEKYGVRRYGFHGASHSYIAWKMGELQPRARRVVSCHLGGSSSVCAILDGRSVATSFGATLQSGLFHNNRVGDMDACALGAIIPGEGGLENAMRALNTASGLKGLSGVSNDMRKVHEARLAGHARAQLAVDAFADNVLGYVGMFAAYLNGLDALVFTGGIGYNDAYLQRRVCENLGYLGVKLADEPDGDLLSASDSRAWVYRLETNEEYMVARNVLRVLEGR